ncbi:phosphogluconate dehydrogenase (NAD(+)-dependent, decarboxylating) [Halothermothrix orenii]|uniref:6-phosphogluconate dehydrogenase (Decarboxylating) n=1 Tax=Halothermothrix orenii (strain H 168 / OCM 544 / DSM 9562) TaxID=373903 RepID=B8CYK8_HALOH|nr:decarboxylating 6-phosphogluconate dehydrogenase [Halothermothrix orenii]ACL70377.1 6-phosphogluconate dehydrogenase (decarboxylating) [Halothermothrix orenii H 168]
MRIGLVGLGRMGYNLALNLKEHGHEVVAYNRSKEKVKKAEKEGIEGAYSLEELVDKLRTRRVIWVMVPAGAPVEQVIDDLTPLLDRGDIIIDGGNSHYRDTLRRYKELKERGIHLVDAGTSGGVEGARHGACMMIGAEDEVFSYLEPVFKDINVDKGYLHTGRVGSGHFVKMVHNGIEYGMLQAIGEGFEVLKESDFDINYQEVARVWSHGSVIRGWLMELTEEAFKKDPELDEIRGIVHSSGEGLWTVEEALKLKVPVPIIAGSLFMRYRSQQEDSFAGKVIAALRNEFGGHKVEKKE